MGQVNTNVTLEGFDDPALGITRYDGVDGETLESSYNQPLSSEVTYSSQSSELKLTVQTARKPLALRVSIDQISLGMKKQLAPFANGGRATVTLQKRSPSLIGMHIRPLL